MFSASPTASPPARSARCSSSLLFVVRRRRRRRTGRRLAARLDGGFTATDSGSARAVERIEAATGTQASPGVVALMQRPRAERRRRCSAQLAAPARDRVASSRATASLSRDGRAAYLAATLTRDADEDAVVAGLDERFAGDGDVLLGGSVFAQQPDRRQRLGGPRPRRDARLPDPAAALAAVLPRPRDGAAARGRDHHRARHVPRRSRSSTRSTRLSIFALNLVIGLGLGLAIDYTLFLVTRFREELGARTRRRRGPHDDEHRRPHRRLQRGDRRPRADHADRLPARLPEVDGDRGRRGRARRRPGRARDLARALRALGREARRAPAPPRAPGGAGRWYRLAHARHAPPAARRARHRRADARRSRCPRCARSGPRSTPP